ncbi:hypothetical protein GJ744_002905 [Endocarpon pusillum]|uniref:Heterokaryon incompatibility domain-containing protein n=1 Tax=Endocarpon pusillum TaxID=364733 RepID=A0A8H7E2F0_9EURO|nr:hypothetical protein GJ744_002905 [Endocarpon pusillum]
MEQLQQGIALTSLPQTFRDAVVLTNNLLLQYLWIHSLCIIQDVADKSDWERECSTVSDIHNGSSVNIAASAVLDSYGFPCAVQRWDGGTNPAWSGLKALRESQSLKPLLTNVAGYCKNDFSLHELFTSLSKNI